MKDKLKIFIIALIAAFSASVTSCSAEEPQGKDEPSPYAGITLTLSETPEDFHEGQTVTMTAALNGNSEELPVTYEWKTTKPSVITVKGEGASAELTAVREGTALVYVYLKEDPDILAQAEVTVLKAIDNTIRILAIGNSFSQDAVEQYLYELFDAADQKVVIGNLYIGGCSLEKHLNNINNDSAAYEYRKVVNGTKTNYKNYKISTALAEESWDYVSIQQVSGFSGVWDSCTPYLPQILEYINKNIGESTKLIWHQTWAYAATSTHSDFAKYEKDQNVMYQAIMDVSKKVMEQYDIDILVPSGTAVQNGRTSTLGDTYCRDGYHLETTYGRYTAACAWYETISGNDVTENPYAPASVDAEKKAIAQQAAHSAVLNPYSVTSFNINN